MLNSSLYLHHGCVTRVEIPQWKRFGIPGPVGYPIIGATPTVWKNRDRIYDYVLESVVTSKNSPYLPANYFNNMLQGIIWTHLWGVGRLARDYLHS